MQIISITGITNQNNNTFSGVIALHALFRAVKSGRCIHILLINIVYQEIWYVKRFTIIFGNVLNMKELRFAENLKDLRISAGLTQKQLAEKLNVDQRTVSAWEKRVCEPNFTLLIMISELFHERIDELLT